MSMPDVLEEPLIVRHRLTVDDYERMAEVGVLAPDARVELIDGEIIEMAAIGTRHHSTVMRLNHLLQVAVGTRSLVSVQAPVRLSSHNEPEPDIALLKPRADFYANAHPAGPDCLLVIEVSDSTLAYDVRIKAPLYARHGVPELWVFDLPGRVLRRFRAPQGEQWQDTSLVADPRLMALPGLADASIDLSGLL